MATSGLSYDNSSILWINYYLLASERSERDTLRSVQLRIADIYIYYIYIVRAIFFLITRKVGGA